MGENTEETVDATNTGSFNDADTIITRPDDVKLNLLRQMAIINEVEQALPALVRIQYHGHPLIVVCVKDNSLNIEASSPFLSSRIGQMNDVLLANINPVDLASMNKVIANMLGDENDTIKTLSPRKVNFRILRPGSEIQSPEWVSMKGHVCKVPNHRENFPTRFAIYLERTEETVLGEYMKVLGQSTKMLRRNTNPEFLLDDYRGVILEEIRETLINAFKPFSIEIIYPTALTDDKKEENLIKSITNRTPEYLPNITDSELENSFVYLPLIEGDEVAVVVRLGFNYPYALNQNARAAIEMYRNVGSQALTFQLYFQKMRENEAAVQQMLIQIFDDLAHEIGNPLATISTSTYLLRKYIEAGKNEDIDKILSRIGKLQHVISQIINEARFFVGLETDTYIPEITEVKGFNDMLSDLTEVNKDHYHNVSISLNLGEILSIQTDESLFKHIFQNIISNALKYSSKNSENTGTVSITSSRKEDNSIVITVSDNGVGIPEDELDRIFEREFRASTSKGFKGSGRGLYIVKKCVDLLNGKILAERNPEGGMKFTIELPQSVVIEN